MQFFYIKSLKEIDLYFDKSQPIFFDTETIGLYGRTRLVQLYQSKEDVLILDCFYINIEDLKYFLKDFHLIGHNIHYDLSCENFRNWLPRMIDDTLIMSTYLWPTLQSFSLSSVAEHLNLGKKTDEGKSDWSIYNLTEEQLKYAAKDVLLLEHIYKEFNKTDLAKNTAYQLDIKSTMLALEYQNRGLNVSSKNATKLAREFKKTLKSIKLPNDLNINSPKQVTEFLSKVAGYEIKSSSEESLAELDIREAEQIKEARAAFKHLTFIEDFKEHKQVFSFINPRGAKTGRFAAKGGDTPQDCNYFNLQQIPVKLKSIFAFNQGEGYYVCADYPALEIWLSGAFINDKFMTSALKEKEDLHTRFAARLFNKSEGEVEKLERRIAKACNFSLLYGSGANTLEKIMKAQGLKDIAANAPMYRKVWLNTYKDIARAIQHEYDYFNQYTSKVVYSALGRPLNATSANEALNYPIQSSGAECTKVAIALLHKNGYKINATIHDSICAIAATEKEAQEYAQAIKECMEEAYAYVIKDLPCSVLRLNVEVNVSNEYT